jgi:hypothetical protein
MHGKTTIKITEMLFADTYFTGQAKFIFSLRVTNKQPQTLACGILDENVG